jgi:hypothetical protein
MMDKRTQREWAAADYREKLKNALKVLVLTPHIRAYLVVMDPKALEQAETALLSPAASTDARLVKLMEGFRPAIYGEVERIRKVDAQEDEREDRKDAMAEHNETPLHELGNDELLAKVATFDAAPPLPKEPRANPNRRIATGHVVWEPEQPAEPCDCAEKAPPDRYWVCPKCDAEWFPKES